MAAPYQDFFGEGGTGVSVAAPVKTPEQLAADEENRKRRERIERQTALDDAANLASRGRQNLLNSGQKVSTVSPGQWGLENYTAQGRPENYSVDAPDDHWADLARFGVAGARTFYGTGIDTAAEALGFGEVPRAVLNPQEYVARAVADEAADQAIPGGSGVSGSNVIPGRAGTGGDIMYPSETIGNDWTTGYRGVGNPPGTPPGGGAGSGSGSGGTGGASGSLPSLPAPVRPDSYRSDAITGDWRALLDAERRQGPSEAEALLLKATDRAAANALGIAATARGGAGSRERAQRQATFSNAAAGSTASADVAALRAREEAERKQRQAAIMAGLQGNAIAGDTRDQGYYESDQTRGASRDNVIATLSSNERIATADRDARGDQFDATHPESLVDALASGDPERIAIAIGRRALG